LRKYNEPHSMLPCSECNIGMMHKTRVTYFTWLADELITVPDFPAWICDVCGKREYDAEALNRLALLLSPLPPKVRRPRVKKTAAKSDSPQASAQPPSPE
jgi:YgiT-type zinc finger domain-containing protein